MPSSPKLFYPHPYSYSRRSTALALCLLIGLSGLVFGFIAISRHGLGDDCKLGNPLSVSVRWDKTSVGSPDEGPKRHKVMGFVGIQTGFGSAGRRGALRRTWFPSDHEGLKRLEESTGLAFRFVIGRTSDTSKMSELKKEVTKYDDFLLLDIEEEYTWLFSKLPMLFMILISMSKLTMTYIYDRTDFPCSWLKIVHIRKHTLVA